MDPHVAEALRSMSQGIFDFSTTPKAAVSGLTEKIESLSGTVSSMQDQLNQRSESIKQLTANVDKSSSSATSTL